MLVIVDLTKQNKGEFEMNEVIINGVPYVPKQAASGEWRIVILHRGFVYVGQFEQDGPNCLLRNAHNVRRWGTSTKGLGELAEKGPLSNTVLDPAGTVRFHELGVINQLDCNQEKWKNV